MKKYFNREFLLSNKNLIIKATVILCMIAAAFFVFVLNETGNREEPAISQTEEELLIDDKTEETELAAEEADSIVVDVGGAVKNPQVVELEGNSRVADAISAAGGLKKNADTTGVNQAAFLTDGEKVYIPAKGESVSGLSAGPASMASAESGFGSNSKINLNMATSEELQTLNGVGPATAEKILDYRNTNGSFKNIEEIKNVNGIGDKTFEKLKEHIMV